MALICPTDGSDNVQVLADRCVCLEDGTFFDFDGNESVGGLQWTSDVPVSAALEAQTTFAAYESQ